MKLITAVLLVAALFTNSSFAQVETGVNPDNKIMQNPKPSLYFPLLYDTGLSMHSGAENLTTVHKGLASLEDYYIGTKWFSENTLWSKAGGILARFAKYIYIDLPVDYFSIVLAHEYFGHGARYREFDIDNIHYTYDFPPPYGAGGGEATNTKSVDISTEELIAIWQGGVEVHPLINRNLAIRWMRSGQMTYREASQYWHSFQIMFEYIQGTNENLADGKKDNDPRAYARLVNALSGFGDVSNLQMSVKDLKQKMMWSLANPFIAYSLYSILKTYLWDGSVTTDVPTIHIGDFNYLPSLRTGLTPFGLEYHFENYLMFEDVVAFVDLSFGDQSFHKGWGGIGIHLQNIYSHQNLSFDLNVNILKQPGLRFGFSDPIIHGDGMGGSLSVRGYYDFKNNGIPLSAVCELGYKSVGFVEGYTLDSQPIIKVGLAVQN